LICHLEPAGRLLLHAGEPGTRCIATAVLPWYRRTMYFWGGASYRPDQHLRRNEALIWHPLRWAKARGVTESDFVGGNSYKEKAAIPTRRNTARRKFRSLGPPLPLAAGGRFAGPSQGSFRAAAARGGPPDPRVVSGGSRPMWHRVGLPGLQLSPDGGGNGPGRQRHRRW
jgi:hypothetical protein